MAAVRRSSVFMLAGAIALIVSALWWGSDRGSFSPEIGSDEASSRAHPVLVGVADETESRREVQEVVEEASAPSASAPTVDELAAARARVSGVIVQGRVVDREARPIAAAAVSHGGYEREAAEVARSGPDGRFEARVECVDGNSSFLVVAEGHAAARLFVPGRTERREGRLHLGTIVLEPGVVVTGLVVDELGEPVRGARVRAYPPSARPGDPRAFPGVLGFAAVAWTSEDGRFRLDGVPPGTAFLYADVDPDTRRGTSEDVELLPGAPNDVRVVLRDVWDYRWIRGHVVTRDGRPLEGVRVRGRPTDANGFFELECVDDTPVTLWVLDPRYRVPVARLDDVPPGTEDLRIVLEPEPLVVALRDEDGRAVADGEIRFEVGDGQRTDPIRLGAATSVSVARPEMPFAVHAEAPGFQPAFLDGLVPEELGDGVEVTLRRGSAARGVVRFEGRPLGGVHVDLVASEDARTPPCRESSFPGGADRPIALLGWPPSGRWVTTAEDGTFSLPVPRDDTYWLWVEADGLGPAAFGPLAIEPAGVDGLEFEVLAPGAIEGRMLVLPGQGVEGRVVVASNGSALLRTTMTDGEGRFRLDDLAPGAYQVRALVVSLPLAEWHPLPVPGRSCAEPIAWDCRVASGEVTRFDLDLRDESSCVLVGSLGAFAGERWQVSLSRAGAQRAGGSSEGGNYRLEVHEGGPYEFRVRGVGGWPTMVRAVDLVVGETRVDLPGRKGVLTVGPRRVDEPFRVVRVEPEADREGWTVRGDLGLGPPFECRGGSVPVGRYRCAWRERLEPDVWHDLGSVEVRAGEETVLALPE